MDDLVDTHEMYLKAVLEFEEAQIEPLRARIAERLDQSAPTVSQTVARMERDELLAVSLADRRVHLTAEGRRQAVRVMRKHRIAECFLNDVVGLDWTQVHREACRWEHVMSDAATDHIAELLGEPSLSPYGNPIPARDDRDWDSLRPWDAATNLVRLTIDQYRPVTARIAWIGESVQTDPALLGRLARSGIVPGAVASMQVHGPSMLTQVEDSDAVTELPHQVAAQLFVAR